MQEKNNTNLERMRELIEQLTEADIAYYKNDAPIMTDLEYDRLTEELASLEHDTGLVLSGSPTQKVSGEILESLAEAHAKSALAALGTFAKPASSTWATPASLTFSPFPMITPPRVFFVAGGSMAASMVPSERTSPLRISLISSMSPLRGIMMAEWAAESIK